MSIFFIGAVFVAGETFGQRCKKKYDTQQSIDACVVRLSKGQGM